MEVRPMAVELEALKKRLYGDNAVKNVKFFPGFNRDASPEDFAREINKFFGEAEGGDGTVLNINADLDCP
jgi:hypothetical protein